ncbi:uncharacterized protein LOC127286993 [Leptopilina boulardi]|uniref:uncharacterized protein LOC127286993 n=1 Tax=Leptopilina boulardi TaxID=63433 RepID=UPI0021F5084C|nr:uncharacterized protein LOC127286993 [Leptopilina boulardi]
MKFVSVYFITYFLSKEILGVSLENSYYNGLINYLQEESKVHQVVFVLNNQLNNTDSIMNSLIKSVTTNFPSLIMTYDIFNSTSIKKKFNKFNYLSRHSTLFVFYNETKKYEQLLKKYFMAPNPRLLIINPFLLSPKYLNDTLHSFWKNKYLDITLLSHNQQRKVMFNKSQLYEVPEISLINPFTNEFFSGKVSSDSQWFPNKLHDLNGYELKFFNLTPIYMSENNEMKIKRMGILQHKMNFKYLFVNQWFNDYAVIPSIVAIDIDLYDDKQLKILKYDFYKFVIPKKIKHSNGIILTEEFWYLVLGTIVMIVIIRLTSFCMRFEKSAWQILNISKIIIGLPPYREPKKQLERIIFGSLLITCIVYSSYFYLVIIDVTWRSESDEISNLKELANSPLMTIMPWEALLKFREKTAPPYYKQIGQKAEHKSDAGWKYDCLRYLVKHQNISCLIPNAENIVNDFATKKEINVKILQEITHQDLTCLKMDYNTPYNDQFNKIIRSAFEFGLMEDFHLSAVPRTKISKPEIIKKEILIFVLSNVLAIGYFLSLIAFLFEILKGKLKLKLDHSPELKLLKICSRKKCSKNKENNKLKRRIFK